MPRCARMFKINSMKNIENMEFTLNTCIEPLKMGGVSYLIGPNNSGKSNIITALERYAKKGFDPSCNPHGALDKKPNVTLVLKTESGTFENNLNKDVLKRSYYSISEKKRTY